MEGDDSIRDFIRVHCKEERYKQRRDLPAEEYPHFVFHLHAPIVIQNLLPFEICIDSYVRKFVVWKCFISESSPTPPNDLAITTKVRQFNLPLLLSELFVRHNFSPFGLLQV